MNQLIDLHILLFDFAVFLVQLRLQSLVVLQYTGTCTLKVSDISITENSHGWYSLQIHVTVRLGLCTIHVMVMVIRTCTMRVMLCSSTPASMLGI